MPPGANVRVGLAGAVALTLGLVLVLASTAILFPAGCNLPGFVCYMQPSSFWATYWPNFLMIDAGFILLSVGSFKAAKPASPLRISLGFGALLSGAILLLPSVGIGANAPVVITFCGADGCPSLTFSQFWSLYWYNYAALAVGFFLVLVGAWFVVAGVRQSRRIGAATLEQTPDPVRQDNGVSLRALLKKAGFALCFALGMVSLLLGEMCGPFPPPHVTFYGAAIVKAMMYASPFLLTMSFVIEALSLDGL